MTGHPEPASHPERSEGSAVLRLRGNARRLGDNINTDYIISSTRKRDTLDEQALTKYLLETVDPQFASTVRPGDILVAGRNFGCGSAMEIAATVILAAGIKAVIAQTFARTFYRNAINNGLAPIECDTNAIREGDSVQIVIAPDRSEIVVRDGEVRLAAAPLPGFMLDILSTGGLVPYLRANGRLSVE